MLFTLVSGLCVAVAGIAYVIIHCAGGRERIIGSDAVNYRWERRK